jgi:ribosomal protein S21|tara:strand:+ start:2178 stop:2393 length:216 start_codon:yes stop_codon:yes gene_type:complete
MGSPIHVEVTLDEVKGNVTRMIKRFIKKAKKMRIVEEYKERMYFTKPSKKRRLAKKRKKDNARKAEKKRKN